MKSNNVNEAILAVSFGTSHEDARLTTLNVIENELSAAFPSCRLYRAWTSSIILKIVRERNNLIVPTISEAMKKMAADGIQNVLIQPTFILPARENDVMLQEVIAAKSLFNSVKVGSPLLSQPQDYIDVIRAVLAEFCEKNDDSLLILMGHGTSHPANCIYGEINRLIKQIGIDNAFVGTVESSPCFEDVLSHIKQCNTKKIILAPFMTVAGEHAKNDMAGTDSSSWTVKLRQEGYDVTPILKSLGEISSIREIFISHAKNSKSI